MKLSKSIVTFLFFSSFLSAFFYALDRTGGNGAPDEIVAIVMRTDLEDMAKKFKKKFD